MVAFLVQAAHCRLLYSVKYNQIIVRYGKAGQAIGKHKLYVLVSKDKVLSHYRWELLDVLH